MSNFDDVVDEVVEILAEHGVYAVASSAEAVAERMILSNVSVNGERQTWRWLYEQEHAYRIAESFMAGIARDLDRCEHGRHEGDVCSSCGGPSKGNPLWDVDSVRLIDRFAESATTSTVPGRLIGFGLDGVPICVPERGADRSPESWYRRG
jgi:hypothetical protein